MNPAELQQALSLVADLKIIDNALSQVHYQDSYITLRIFPTDRSEVVLPIKECKLVEFIFKLRSGTVGELEALGMTGLPKPPAVTGLVIHQAESSP